MNLYRSKAPNNALKSGTIIFFAENPRAARQIASAHFQAPSAAKVTDPDTIADSYDIELGEIESIKDGAMGQGNFRILTLPEGHDDEEEEEF